MTPTGLYIFGLTIFINVISGLGSFRS